MGEQFTRRKFFGASAVGITAAPMIGQVSEKPAILGGKPVRAGKYPSWPIYDQKEEQALLDVVRSGKWYRGSGKQVARFEEAYAKITGAKYCLATSSGTTALFTSLNALGWGRAMK